MKYSCKWLQSYFEEPLPPAAELAEVLTMRAFEVEAIEGDLLDVKILPDRAHDCLSHRGLARELAAILGRQIREEKREVPELVATRPVRVAVEHPELCLRYMARVVENVMVVVSPDWLSARLALLGERSINNLVDAANFVMFDIGQPMHVFDADKVSGHIAVRYAKEEEQMTTLDGLELKLSKENLIIADDVGPLALAGIKGGTRAAVTAETKNIIIEAANFAPPAIRKTARRLNLLTDAAKRFENEIAPELAPEAMDYYTSLLGQIAGGQIKVGSATDHFFGSTNTHRQIFFSPVDINRSLGLDLPETEIINLLGRLRIKVEGQGNKLMATVPQERLDLKHWEDLVEEVGRLYGYERLPEQNIENSQPAVWPKELSVTNRVRQALVGLGFAEHYGHSFAQGGEVELANPLTSDRAFLRTNLSDGLRQRVEAGRAQVVFDHEEVKLFEFGKVFTAAGEEMHLAIAGGDLSVTWAAIGKALGIAELPAAEEIKFSDLVERATITDWPDLSIYLSKNKYRPISSYPRIMRDVAVFVPGTVMQDEVEAVIKNNASELLVSGPTLFDEFKKDDKVSYAFRLVFQALDRTLQDVEVNEIMGKISTALEQKPGWQVRG